MREMKDSGVAWIGEIPKEWEISLINTLYTVRNTKVSDVDYQPLSVTMKGIVPQLSTAAKTNAHDDRKLVKKGDFAINSRSDRRGSCGISDYDGSVSLINTVLSPRNEMNPIYYSWLFHSSEFADEFYRWGHGIVDDLWTTRWQEMRNISIPVPPLSIQHQIAAYLDQKCTQIDALIINQQKQIERLKAYKQSLITETVTKGLNPDVPMKDSGVEWIGEIPEDTPSAVDAYRRRISGPLLDRIDLHVEALPVEYDDLASEQGGESSADVRARVMAARALQRARYKALPGVRCNAQLPSGALRRYCRMTPAAEKILRSAFERLGYSARAYDRILRVARTVADLDGSEVLDTAHLSETLQYRTLDRKFGM